MKKAPSYCVGFIPASLSLALGLLVTNANAQNGYFDVNGATAGYGTTAGGSYSWDDPDWATASGGGAATGSSPAGAFARFLGPNSYTVTVNNTESMAGMVQAGTSGSTLTINAAGSGNLNIVASASLTTGLPAQGFFVATGQSCIINAPITGPGGISLALWNSATPSISLYGNNTYSGGTVLQSSSYLVNFNNNNSFGTGPINVNGTTFAPLLAQGGSTITLANNWTNISNSGVNFGSAANTPVVLTGPWALQTYNLNLRNNGDSTAPLTVQGIISGSGNLSLSANNNGTVILSGANTFSGTTTVGRGNSAVTLKLGAANTIASSSSVIMAGGILDLGGFSHAMGATTLGLTDNSSIDFGAGASELDLANSSATAWTSGKVLNLVNWTFGSDAMRFGTDVTGLTSAQLADIEFNGDASTLGSATLDYQGYLVVPEPSIAALGLVGALGAWVTRRRQA